MSKVIHRERYKGYSIEVIKENVPDKPYKAIAYGFSEIKRDDTIEGAVNLLKALINFSIDMNKSK